MLSDYLPDFTSENIQFDPANQHCTFTQTRDGHSVTTKFSVIGFPDPIFALREKFPRNSQHEKFGTLTDLTISQSEGPHWVATFTYSKESADDDTESGTGTLTGPKSSQLTVRMMSRPIETARNYRKIWNHHLWVDMHWYYFRINYLPNNYWERRDGRQFKIDEMLNYILEEDGAIYKSDGVKYHKDIIKDAGLDRYVKWSDTYPSDMLQNSCNTMRDIVKNTGTLRENNDGAGLVNYGGKHMDIEGQITQYGVTDYVDRTRAVPPYSNFGYAWSKKDTKKIFQYRQDVWMCWHRMTKPGISTFDYPVYEMQEVSKHVGKKAAGWAIAEVAGRISEPKYGDFGIVEQLGGDWLCLGGQVQYNGDFWQASRTYQHSPDGWDDDIYREGQREKQ